MKKAAALSVLTVLAMFLCLGNTKCGAGLSSSGGTTTTGSGPVIFYGGKPGTLAWRGLGVAQSGPHKGARVWVEIGTAALAGAVTGAAAAQAASSATGTPIGQISSDASSATATASNPCPPGTPKWRVVTSFPETTPGLKRNITLKCSGYDRFRTGRIFRRSDLKKCIQNILSKGGYREGRPNTTEPAHQYSLNGNGFSARMSVTSNGTIASVIFRRGNLVRCANA
jgi:hypothetical protein